MIVTVLYPVKPENTFDLDYYLKTHMPLVDRLWGPEGLKEAHVLKGVGTPGGGDASFHIAALLHFDSLEAFQGAAAKHGAEVLGDVKNFTDAQPSIQFNEKVL